MQYSYSVYQKLSSVMQYLAMNKSFKGKVDLEINVGSARKLTTWNGSQVYFQCSPRQVSFITPQQPV